MEGTFWTSSDHIFSYHISLCGDAKPERVDAAGGEDSEVRSQSAAGCQSDFLLKHAAGRQHGPQAAVRRLQLVEDLHRFSAQVTCPDWVWGCKRSLLIKTENLPLYTW